MAVIVFMINHRRDVRVGYSSTCAHPYQELKNLRRNCRRTVEYQLSKYLHKSQDVFSQSTMRNGQKCPMCFIYLHRGGRDCVWITSDSESRGGTIHHPPNLVVLL